MAATLCHPRYRKSGQASNAEGIGFRRNPRVSYDAVDGGDGQLSNPLNDPITLDGAPYQTRLRVFEERSGRLVRETWSAADGTWIIRYLRRDQTYLVVCYDATYPALAYDHVTPDAMT